MSELSRRIAEAVNACACASRFRVPFSHSAIEELSRVIDAELQELERDRSRLDWLSDNQPVYVREGQTLREAIDAAREATGG